MTYYTRSYSKTNNENIEHGPGFILSFIENTGDEGYTLIRVEHEFPVCIGPSDMFDGGTHFIDWDDGKFKLTSIRS